jgi:hypothetical protein
MRKVITFSLIAYALIISTSTHCMLAHFISTRPSKKILNLRGCHSSSLHLRIIKEEKSLVYGHELKYRNQQLLKLIAEQNETIKEQEEINAHNLTILNSPNFSLEYENKELRSSSHLPFRIKALEASLVYCANHANVSE